MSRIIVLLVASLISSVYAFGVYTPLQTGSRSVRLSIRVIQIFLRQLVVHPPNVSFAFNPKVTTDRRGASGLVMRARVCDLLGKRHNRQARQISFSHTRTKKVQEINLQTKRFFSDELGRSVTLRLSTKGLKTVDKYGGIDAAAKKFGLDLSTF
jgi:large subunit ribosomal protein L28